MKRRVVVVILLVASALMTTAPANAALTYTVVQSDPGTVNAGDLALTQKVKCPSNMHVVSGGVDTSGIGNTSQVSGSAPFDSRKDADRKPDDGWRGSVTNSGVNTVTMVTYAVCSKSGTFKYFKSTGQAPDANASGHFVNCGSGHVTGGGAEVSTFDFGISIGSLNPIDDDSDLDSEIDNGWRAVVNNDSGGPISMTVWAICETQKSYSYFSQSQSATPGVASAQVNCAGTKPLVGGGATVNPMVDVFLQFSRPEIGEPADPLDDQWGTQILNESIDTVTYAQFWICRNLT